MLLLNQPLLLLLLPYDQCLGIFYGKSAESMSPLRLFRLLFQFLLLQHELVMRHLPQQQTWALRGKSLDCWLQNEPFKHVTSLATFACIPNLVLTDLRIFFLTRSGCISYPLLFDLRIMIQHERGGVVAWSWTKSCKQCGMHLLSLLLDFTIMLSH